MVHEVTAIDEMVSGAAIPALYIFRPYNVHEQRPIINVKKAKDDFLSIAYMMEAMPIDVKSNTDTAK